jgi:hypothetical protein
MYASAQPLDFLATTKILVSGSEIRLCSFEVSE